jgi:hypothetical protein
MSGDFHHERLRSAFFEHSGYRGMAQIIDVNIG